MRKYLKLIAIIFLLCHLVTSSAANQTTYTHHKKHHKKHHACHHTSAATVTQTKHKACLTKCVRHACQTKMQPQPVVVKDTLHPCQTNVSQTTTDKHGVSPCEVNVPSEQIADTHCSCQTNIQPLQSMYPCRTGIVGERTTEQEKIPLHYLAIETYKPNYVLPIYFTASPDNTIYQNNTPNNENLNKAEVKFQISIKVPVVKNIYHQPSSLYFAYTQLSYWQLYNHKAFIRETDYEPELFFANEINYHYSCWDLNFFNAGLVHQSNGFGNSLERSWNRFYLEAIASTDSWMVSLKPWYVFRDKTYNQYNPNLANYLGYGRVLVAYKYSKNVFSIEAHNLIEAGGKHATAEVAWSFPISTWVKGYVQVFSGYGQSLVEYNHRTNSVGIGVALNDWV